MKILFLVQYPIEGACNRYRVNQYIPYLRKNNFDLRIRSFIVSKLYNKLYNNTQKKQKPISKFIDFTKCSINRAFDLIRSLKYDVIFIHRECFPLGPPIMEFILSKILLKPIIYDFDDALFLKEKNPQTIFPSLKNPNKFKKIIKLADYVIAGNKYLNKYASRFNQNVITIPTSIETKKFKPAKKKENKIIIGWIGSYSTIKYVLEIQDVFKELAKKYDFELKIVGAGKKIEIPGVKVINKKWSLNNEIEDFQGLTIGVYPVSHNTWSLGKCGFKAIQYMATGVPVVASPIGVNKDIIKDGKNGFLAKNKQEWIKKLSKLIENKKLRERFASAGRKTIEKEYATSKTFIELKKILNQIKNEKKIA